MAKVDRKRKPGPEDERVKIEGDPHEALRKLVTTLPPTEPEPETEEGEKLHGEERPP